jgi:hypothetical protein
MIATKSCQKVVKTLSKSWQKVSNRKMGMLCKIAILKRVGEEEGEGDL